MFGNKLVIIFLCMWLLLVPSLVFTQKLITMSTIESVFYCLFYLVNLLMRNLKTLMRFLYMSLFFVPFPTGEMYQQKPLIIPPIDSDYLCLFYLADYSYVKLLTVIIFTDLISVISWYCSRLSTFMMIFRHLS